MMNVNDFDFVELITNPYVFFLIFVVYFGVLLFCSTRRKADSTGRKIDSKSILLKHIDACWIAVAVFSIFNLSFSASNDLYSSRIELIESREKYEILILNRDFSNYVNDVACHSAILDKDEYKNFCEVVRGISKIYKRDNIRDFDLHDSADKLEKLSKSLSDDIIIDNVSPYVKSAREVIRLRSELEKYKGYLKNKSDFFSLKLISILLLLIFGPLRLLKSAIEVLDAAEASGKGKKCNSYCRYFRKKRLMERKVLRKQNIPRNQKSLRIAGK